MENDIVIFWLVCLTCVSGLVFMAMRARSAARGSMAFYGAILAIDIIGRFWNKSGLIYTAAGMWVVFGLIPGMLSRAYVQRFLQQRYTSAYWLARMIGWLHPTDGWRQQPQLIRALELAQKGDLARATEMLKHFQEVRSVFALNALINLYRITNQWEELIAWHRAHPGIEEQYPQLLPVLLRAYGEAGDVHGMVALYDSQKQHVAKLVPVTSRDLCRLPLFAFAGKRQCLEHLFAGTLAILPQTIQQYWLATADLAAGDATSARRQWEELLPEADEALRRSIERRLSRIEIIPDPLDSSAERLIAETAREHSHDQSFGARPSLFSKRAGATQLLILLNVLMFAVETLAGGSTNPETLYRLGALFPAGVRAGEWWRLVSSIFLHWGPLHLAMNMLALWVLGPFAEFAFGFRRFLIVYLVAGLGSMGVVTMFATGPKAEELAVGASGCIMGLVGATGALMLRGWLRERALSARQRLLSIIAVVVTQTLFDSLVPQVSMTAHLSGVLIGFVLTLALRDRLRTEPPALLTGRTLGTTSPPAG